MAVFLGSTEALGSHRVDMDLKTDAMNQVAQWKETADSNGLAPKRSIF